MIALFPTAAIYSLKEGAEGVSVAQPKLFTNGVTRGQLNKGNEALQLKESKSQLIPNKNRRNPTSERKIQNEGFGCFLSLDRPFTLRAQRVLTAASGSKNKCDFF